MERQRLIQATCPECRGPLREVQDGGVVEYRCSVDHRYSPLSLLLSHSETQERTLWAAVLVLEEADVVAREVSRHVPASAATLLRQGEHKRAQARTIRGVLEELEPFHAND